MGENEGGIELNRWRRGTAHDAEKNKHTQAQAGGKTCGAGKRGNVKESKGEIRAGRNASMEPKSSH